MKVKKIQAIRGMNDWLPSDSFFWQSIETTIKTVFNQYGYREIRTPILEETALFKRAVGEVTDIVEKEMYTFLDRNEESVTLRPELTASCVRMGIEKGLFYNQEQRLWYFGPAFRYERPQKGRYRQFHQFGVEVFGLAGPDVDAELILMTARLWRELGLSDQVTLQINSIGSLEERQTYKAALVDFLMAHYDQLDEDCQRRLTTNPLRILDSKNTTVQALLRDAPQLLDYLGDVSKAHFQGLCQRLDLAGIAYQVNPCLVRGLDYYNYTVFEWITTRLGAQGTICGGGRYDGLVAQLGGQPTPAVGFAIGAERLLLLIEALYPEQKQASMVDIYVVSSDAVVNGIPAIGKAQQIAERLRSDLPVIVMTHYGTSSMKKQFMRADKLGAKIVLVVGEEELLSDTVTLKTLQTGDQQRVAMDAVVDTCRIILSLGETA